MSILLGLFNLFLIPFWAVTGSILLVISFLTDAILFQRAGVAGIWGLIPFVKAWKRQEICFGRGQGWRCLIFLIPFVGELYLCYTNWVFAKVYSAEGFLQIMILFFTPLTKMILIFGGNRYCGPLNYEKDDLFGSYND